MIAYDSSSDDVFYFATTYDFIPFIDWGSPKNLARPKGDSFFSQKNTTVNFANFGKPPYFSDLFFSLSIQVSPKTGTLIPTGEMSKSFLIY